MFEPQSPRCVAVWRRERQGSTAGPTSAAQYAPRQRLRQVGIWRGLMLLGGSPNLGSKGLPRCWKAPAGR
eukprot:1900475-Lingulodinium_polyedra.AAC.1